MFMNDRQLAAKKLLDSRRTCTGACGQLKFPEEYPKNTTKKGLRDTECLICKRERSKLYRASDAGRNAYLLMHYGITLENYNELLHAQHGVCKVCKLPETTVGTGGSVLPLAVDHNHSTNEVRGLLCRRCNTGIGLFGDDFKLALEVAKYLQRVP